MTGLKDKYERLNAKLDALSTKLHYLEEMCRGGQSVYLGDNKILFKAFVFGANIAFILDAKDRLFVPWFVVSGHYETALTNYLVPRLKADSHCIDVGANFGYFTCLFSRFCPQGKIIGIEPDPEVYRLLRENIFINGFESRAKALNMACSDAAGMMTLYRRSSRSGNTSIINVSVDYTNAMGEDPTVPFSVTADTIDSIAQQMGGHVDFIKIDVEGAEPLVIQGIGRTLEHNPELEIIMEWSPGQIRAAGFDIPTFITAMEALNLSAFSVAETGITSPIMFSDLTRAPYMAAIILRRMR